MIRILTATLDAAIILAIPQGIAMELTSNSKPEIIAQTPAGWELSNSNNQITKLYTFATPLQAAEFRRLIDIKANSKEINHHPDYNPTIEDNEASITLTTHHAKTRPVPYLGINDIKLAKLIDLIYLEREWELK